MDQRTADAPVLFGNGNAEIPSGAKTRKEIDRPLLVAIHARRQRVELTTREPIGLVEDLLLF
jgi:hypothetical protein